MLDIEEAKFPPPKPESAARIQNTQSGVVILQRDADTQSRDDQQQGGEEDHVASTRDANQEGARDPQRRAGQSGNGVEGKELGLGERKLQIEHLGSDNAPIEPDGKSAEQTRDRNPQISLCDFLAGRAPEFLVFDLPLVNVDLRHLTAPFVMTIHPGRRIRSPRQRRPSVLRAQTSSRGSSQRRRTR